MDGDSLTRDTLYDLLEMLGLMRPCRRVKSHMHQVFKFPGLDLWVTLGFNPASRNACELPRWNSFKTAKKLAPDFWIWSGGLWFAPRITGKKKSAVADYEKRLKCLGELKKKGGAFGGTKGIFRSTTPYADDDRRGGPLDKLHERMNKQSKQILVDKYGWQELDAWGMMFPKGKQFTVDGTHYTGAGSKWIANVLLNIMCGNMGASNRSSSSGSVASEHGCLDLSMP